jgi:thymidylate synthase (FAD)
VVSTSENPIALTAAMARISRSPKTVEELVAEAKVKAVEAAKSAEKIIFDFGHASVWEHCTIHLGVWDISRLTSLQLCNHRLASFTQLSYRYLPFEEVKKKFFYEPSIPPEVLHKIIHPAVEEAYRAYQEIYPVIRDYLIKEQGMKELEATRKATEDARYVLPICQTTQIGISANAREIACICRRLLSSRFPEWQALGDEMKQAVVAVAPPLFREEYFEATFYPWSAEEKLACLASSVMAGAKPAGGQRGVQWLKCEPEDEAAESYLAAHLFYPHLSHSQGSFSLADALDLVCQFSAEQLSEVLDAAAKGLTPYDTVLRAFEHLRYEAELVMSETAYHQFIRHRIGERSFQRRNPRNGFTTPELIKEVGLTDRYETAIQHLETAYFKLEGESYADYLLANAHHLRVRFSTNARHLVEVSRLRQDLHAQWDVRGLVNQLIVKVVEKQPFMARYFGGRDAFKEGRLLVCQLTKTS